MNVTAAMVAVCDTCPYNADTLNVLAAVWDNPKWVDACQAAWREVVAMGADAIQANVDYVNGRLGTDMTADWIKQVYAP